MKEKLYNILEKLQTGDKALINAHDEILDLFGVSQQSELLKKWWKFFDEESIAVNCNDKERATVINEFFNCG